MDGGGEGEEDYEGDTPSRGRGVTVVGPLRVVVLVGGSVPRRVEFGHGCVS